MLAVIDADAIVYFSSKETLEESKQNIDSIIEEIIQRTGSTHCYLFLSEGKYFRHNIDENYKIKRKDKESNLLWIKELKLYLKEFYKAISIDLLEADDLVAYVMYNDIESFPNKIMCSPDKDVLKQVKGRGYNYQKKEFTNNSNEDAFKFLCIQSLMGDSSDCIQGIPGIGEVKANKMLKDVNVNLQSMIPVVLKEYLSYYKSAHQGVYEFQKNFRLVYLLRKPQDFIQEIGYTPELPPPNKIIVEN